MIDKYNMTKEDNIFYAKRLLVDNVYKSANLEGIAVTFAQTNDILNDVNIEDIKPSDIGKVFGLRDAWNYCIENIDKEIDLAYIEEIHYMVAKSELGFKDLGNIRTNEVIISGTNWRPEIPNPEILYNELNEIKQIKNITDRALTLMLWIMRTQIFRDGNKRVATIMANKVLIENGKGILAIPVELDGTFKTMLVEYYETNKMEKLKSWLYENCITGV